MTPASHELHACDPTPGPPDPIFLFLTTTDPPGDDDAHIAEALMPEITAMAAHYSDTSPIAEQAFVSAGLGGLQRAMEHYAPEQRAPFEPYAMWWIRQAMETLRSGRG